ncbi:unnamed protein product [Oreochromis niloticus]|nr:unnamed protein product [Mustela putorius furo]
MNSVPCGIKKSYKKNGGRKTESRPRGKHSRRRCWGLLGWSKFRANYQTVQATRKKEEFDRVLKAQQEAEAKEKEQQERQRQKVLRHAEAVRQQVNERKQFAKAERRERFREADKLLEEAQQRQIRLNEIKEKKLKELRVTGLGEKYCCEVERKAQKTHFV